MFRVISKTQLSDFNSYVNTNHNDNERGYRNKQIEEVLGGYGKGICSFIVDTNHPNGYEIHTITDNGVIVIQNERTKRIVTALIARENQIRRYFVNGVMPIEIYAILSVADSHHKKGYNNW